MLIQSFIESGSPEPKLDASLILEYNIGKNSTWIFIHNDYELTSEEENKILQMMERRVKGEPIAYITEHREFWTLNLKCSPLTLIPQPDTEILVDEALKLISSDGCSILDLATGTGAVALAIKKECPNADVYGSDYFDEVIELAKENSELNNVSVTFFQSDWFEKITKSFNIITANPPYVAENDYHLGVGDVRFEPKSALVAKNDGLADLETIIQNAPKYLFEGGWLLVEHGFDQKAKVQNLFSLHGFKYISTVKDYGGNDRVTKGQFLKGVINE